MFPYNDINIKLQTPFSRRSQNNKHEILNDGRPIIVINNSNIQMQRYVFILLRHFDMILKSEFLYKF
jgi:hypothetical protein